MVPGRRVAQPLSALCAAGTAGDRRAAPWPGASRADALDLARGAVRLCPVCLCTGRAGGAGRALVKERKMRSMLRVLVTLSLVVVALVAGYGLWQHYMLAPWTRDARVRADVVVISPDVSGWVMQLKVRDNQQVKAGDLLLSIDRERYQAALEKARAVADTRLHQLRLRE